MPDSAARNHPSEAVISSAVATAFITILVIVGVVMIYAMIREWRAGHHEPHRELPPLVIPSTGRSIVRAPATPRAPVSFAPPNGTGSTSPNGAGAATSNGTGYAPANGSGFAAPPAGRGYPSFDPTRGDPSPMETVRFRRPAEDALQLLPGRLEVLTGEPHHREIRFVRIPGERPQLILGRDPGSSPQHVALQSLTVSRRHARLAFANGAWAVSNLSATNPLVVNDESLATGDGERPLSDGDRIELGEVVLRFHAR